MIRPTSLILMALAAAAGGALFQIAFEVAELDGRLSHLNRNIRADREAIHVLHAEWSFLNQLGRLEELARRHLDLQPVSGGQLAGAGAVPVRAAEDGAPGVQAAALESAPEAAAMRMAAPKARPAAPDRRHPLRTAARGAGGADPGRSLEDVLREVLDAPDARGGRR